MLDRDALDKYGPAGFSLGQKEKDYAQHWVLSFLSRTGFNGVFKGGTCLQKAYNLPRYSEDLDFNLDGTTLPDFGKAVVFLEAAGFAGATWKTESSKSSDTIKLRFRGPLYNGKSVSEGTIRMEFSKRERTTKEPTVATINPAYPDILPYQMKTMDAAEMAAEKIRAIMTRDSARDLYDLFFLLRRGAEPDKMMVSAKLGYCGKEYDKTEFAGRVKKIGKIWETEMRALTPSPLDYAATAGYVLDKCGKLLR